MQLLSLSLLMILHQTLDTELASCQHEQDLASHVTDILQISQVT